MKRLIVVLYVLCFGVSTNVLFAKSDLTPYCSDPTIALAVLKHLRVAQWNSLSITEIQSKWPTVLQESHSCDSSDDSKQCLIYIHRTKDKEFCCCGVSFYFDRDVAGKPVFNSVVLNIANRSREKVLSFMNQYLKSMAPDQDEVYVDPWAPVGVTVEYDKRSVMNAYSFISPSSDKIFITVALQPLGNGKSDDYYWWLRLTMTKNE